jgi:glycosyltransferase involved in cell wall biosynthesis
MEKTRHRIAHVITESEPFGGAQRNTLLTLKGLVRDGYEPELLCGPEGRLISEAEAIGVKVHVIPALVRQLDPLKDSRAFFRLYRLFRSQDYSIVHTHSTKAGVVGRVAAWLARVPVIIHTVHGVPFELDGNLRSRFYFALERCVGYLSDSLICVGEVLRQEVASWKIVPDRKLVTVYSGIDFSSYVLRRTPLEMKQVLGLEEAWPIVGSVGRLSEQKAQRYLIQAVALLKEKYPQIKLLLVGEGQLRPLLEKQIQDLGLSSNVFLLGEQDDIADLLNIFDVYAMSSRWEGVGRSLTEAMYWGLPIVATAVNGVKELIVHEETGLFAPPQDPKALATAVDRLASDRKVAKRLGSHAQKKCRELMDGEHMIIAIEKLYGSLSNSKFHNRSAVSKIHKPIDEKLKAGG